MKTGEESADGVHVGGEYDNTESENMYPKMNEHKNEQKSSCNNAKVVVLS